MTYVGEIRQGVVVLRDAPSFDDGTMVTVEIKPEKLSPRRGSAEAVLQAALGSGGWADSNDEMDDALAYIRKTKRDEVLQQQADLEPGS